MMSRNKMVLVTALALSLTTIGGGLALASPGEDEGYHYEGRGEARHERMMSRLDLTTEQREEIGEIMRAQRELAMDKREDLKRTREALRAAAEADEYNASRVESLAEEHAAIHKDLIVMRTETAHRINQVLTPEQRAELEELRERRRAHRWHDRD